MRIGAERWGQKRKGKKKKKGKKKYNFFRNFMENHGDKVGLG